MVDTGLDDYVYLAEKWLEIGEVWEAFGDSREVIRCKIAGLICCHKARERLKKIK